MKDIYKKWWFWVIVIIILGAIIGGQNKKTETKEENNSPYITKYEWNISDTKTFDFTYSNGDTEQMRYVVLGVENKDKDLQVGEYNIKTDGVDKSSFIIYVTDKYYENANDLPEPYTDMVQDTNSSVVKLEKGQYLYLVKASTGSDNGKVFVEKK